MATSTIEGWKRKQISEVCLIISGGTPSTQQPEFWNGSIPWATPTDITKNGKFIDKTEKTISEKGLKNSSATLLPINSILMTSRATIGARCINLVPMTTNQGFKSFVCNKSEINYEFLYYLIEILHKDFIALASGSTFLEISKKSIDSFLVDLPPLPEQKKIAEILSTWDEAIEFNEKLLDTEKQQKRVYVSYIYTKRHVTDIENVKKFEKLGKHLVEKTERNKDELINDVLSVSNTRGFVLQSAQFEREIASKDKKNYKVVRKDQFAYNPSRVNVGSIDQLSERDSGIISPMYVVFQCKDSIKGRYLYHFLKSDYFLRLIPRFTQGSVRDSLSFDGLCEMKIHIPSIEKQTKYSQLLDSLDIKIKLIERNIEYLKTQKQGLMQRLLTGKVRVKLD